MREYACVWPTATLSARLKQMVIYNFMVKYILHLSNKWKWAHNLNLTQEDAEEGAAVH